VWVNNAENCLPDICANRSLDLFNKDLSVFFFFQRHTDKPDVTPTDGWKFEKSDNEFRFDFGDSEN